MQKDPLIALIVARWRIGTPGGMCLLIQTALMLMAAAMAWTHLWVKQGLLGGSARPKRESNPRPLGDKAAGLNKI